jgi:hypothetical protein
MSNSNPQTISSKRKADIDSMTLENDLMIANSNVFENKNIRRRIYTT